MTREYFNKMAKTWDETVAEKDTGKLRRMADRLDIAPGASLLDVGSGTGVFIPYLLEKIGKNGHLTALDFAKDMLEKAKTKGFQGNIEYICADIAAVPRPDGFYDAVVCYSSFPHFRDKPKAFREINRLLKEGGKLFICHTASRAKINGIHGNILLLKNDLIPEGGEVRGMMEAAGFTDVEIWDEAESYLVRGVKEGH